MENPFIDRNFRLVRKWSNSKLRKICCLFEGEVVNVSAWLDEDKEGGFYRDYFPQASQYYTTNYGGYRGEGLKDSIALDLTAALPDELHQRFDVVFNHTALNHVFDIFLAVKNLSLMSRDLVVIVVPQVMADCTTESFDDYWRFTPTSITELFKRNGLETVFITSSPFKNSAIYHLAVGSKNPENWKNLPIPDDPLNYGYNVVREGALFKAGKLLNRFFQRN